jgi:hypothetical protein
MSARPGKVIDVADPGRVIVTAASSSAISSARSPADREEAARRVDEDDGQDDDIGMRRVRVTDGRDRGSKLLLEALCVGGVIDKAMPPPHRIAIDFFKLLTTKTLYPEIGKSMANVLLAFVLAYVLGIVIGTALHGYKTLRDTLDPLFATYYAIPVFAFYPLFIVIFGLGDGPRC